MNCLGGCQEILHFPAFIRLGYSNVTFTGSGNSTLNTECSYCCWKLHEMIITIVIQIKEMKSFLSQVAGSGGDRSTLLTCDKTDTNIQTHVAKAYAVE